MPVFQKAETKIKELILVAFLLQSSIIHLRLQIDGVIEWVKTKIPTDLNDKNAYIRGLKAKSEQFILLYYKKPTQSFKVAKNEVLHNIPKVKTAPNIPNPSSLNDLIKPKGKLWVEAKGNPNVTNYQKELKRTIENLAADPITTYEPGKKPISLWQKAELDVRYKNQIQMLQNLRVEGVEYAWISSHPNCSKRCQPWQGKLVALQGHANGTNHLMGYVDGNPCYSLVDIMAKVDKYGYRNNIICGFNCRHRLIPYKKGVYGPKEYTDKDVAKERKIDQKMREMEREIRKIKTKEILYSKMGDIKSAEKCRREWKRLFEYYKKFCESNGYAWYAYRINVI